MSSPPSPALLIDLLKWQAEMGVDAALAESARDWLAAPPAQSPAPQSGLPEAKPPAPAPPPPSQKPLATADETVQAATASARAATNLTELRAALERFEGCNLKFTANNLVFADGNPSARLMLVGEAPGREEDLEGLPFVGRSGQLLDRMLAAIGLDRGSVYIANVVPWRPPGNRTPTPQESAACAPFIRRQIELADPDILVCLGAAAVHEIFATGEGILKLRGQWRSFDTGKRTIRAMAMLHPAYLLRQPLQKRLAWRDLLSVKAALSEGDKPPGGRQ